jgi:hypothetical protein
MREEEKQMRCDTTQNRAVPGCRRMRPLPTEPLEILRYALGELEQTACPDDEAHSTVWIRNILNEGIAFFGAEAAGVSPREPLKEACTIN